MKPTNPLGYEAVTYQLDAIDTTVIADRTDYDTPIVVNVNGVSHAIVNVGCSVSHDGQLTVILDAE
jgi:hypothetical protein